MITITMTIDAATAVRAGRSQAGKQALQLSDNDIAELTEVQRETLARHLAEERYYADALCAHAAPVADASLSTLKDLLDQREAYAESMRARQAAADEQEAEDAAAEAAERSAAEAKFARIVAEMQEIPIGELDGGRSAGSYFKSEELKVLRWEYKTVAEVLGRQEEWDAYLAEKKKAKERERHRQEAELCAWLEERDPALAAQHREGLLDRAKILALLEEHFIAQGAKGCGLVEISADIRYFGRVPEHMEPDAYKAWTAMRKKLEAAFENSYTLYDYKLYRKATDADATDDIDDDGDVFVKKAIGVEISKQVFGYTLSEDFIIP